MAANFREIGPFGGSGGSDLDAKTITAVYSAETSSTSGTVSPPTGGTLIEDHFASGVDAYCSTVTTGFAPDKEVPTESDGTPVVVSSFVAATGAFTLSGTPSSFPVAIVFAASGTLAGLDISDALEAYDLDDVLDPPSTVSDLGTLGATLIMDMVSKGKAEFEAATSATALTISITNPPVSGLEGEATIMLDTTTLPASITFPSGSVDAPTITEGFVWELSFKTIDGGTTWRVIGKEWSS